MRLIRLSFWKPNSNNLKPLAFLKWNSAALTLTQIVWREMCILQFCTEARIYSKIMQNMKSARKQFKTPAWHRRRDTHVSLYQSFSKPLFNNYTSTRMTASICGCSVETQRATRFVIPHSSKDMMTAVAWASAVPDGSFETPSSCSTPTPEIIISRRLICSLIVRSSTSSQPNVLSKAQLR